MQRDRKGMNALRVGELVYEGRLWKGIKLRRKLVAPVNFQAAIGPVPAAVAPFHQGNHIVVERAQ